MIRPQTQAGKAMKKLVSALADYRDPLGPGVAIQRKGAVHDMFVESGRVSFEVEDGRERGFDVTIHVSPANENIHHAVREGNFHEAVPKVGDVQIHHVCPEWASPCKHEIAALLELTKIIDDDHHILLTWRGIQLPLSQKSTNHDRDSEEQWSTIRRTDTDRKKTIEAIRDQLPQQFVQFEETPNTKPKPAIPELLEFFSGRDKDLEAFSIPKITKTIQNPLLNLPKDSETNMKPILEEASETIAEYWLTR